MDAVTDDVASAREILGDRRWFELTGARVSTDSGIPAQQFVSEPHAQKLYLERSRSRTVVQTTKDRRTA